MAEKQQLIKIVRELKSGNKNMAAVLYEAYYRDLHYYILKRVNDPGKAEALTKDTFIEIYENVSSLKDAKHFVEWSRQLADRRCEEYRRARRALLSEKVGGAVLESVEEERKEIHLDATEDDVSYSTETKRRSGFKNGARLLESIARKVIVGVVAALILTMIKESGIDWLYMGGVFESAEEESTTSKSPENTEEESFVDDTEQVELTEVQTNTESENDKSSSAAETESESATTEAEIQPTEPEETQSPSTTPEPTEAELTTPEPTETEPATPEPTKTEPATPEATKPEPTTQVVIIPETTEPDETKVEEMLQLELGNGYWYVAGIGTYTGTDIELVIPETIDGLPVVHIGGYAFSQCVNLKSIILPENIVVIQTGAFIGCTNLESIYIPEKVSSIDANAFSGCSSLTSITLPKQLIMICDGTFIDCTSLTEINVPKKVASIGRSAFSGCVNLNEIIISAGVSSIDGSAFYNCKNLEKIIIAPENPTYYSENNCIIAKASKKLVLCGSRSAIPMDGSITSIGDYACVNCTEWTEVTIPEGVTHIGDYAFDFLKLKKVTIPASVTSIGDYAFRTTENLATIIFGGTKEQWMAIEKGTDWRLSAGGNSTIYCTDGEIRGFGTMG